MAQRLLRRESANVESVSLKPPVRDSIQVAMFKLALPLHPELIRVSEAVTYVDFRAKAQLLLVQANQIRYEDQAVPERTWGLQSLLTALPDDDEDGRGEEDLEQKRGSVVQKPLIARRWWRRGSLSTTKSLTSSRQMESTVLHSNSVTSMSLVIVLLQHALEQNFLHVRRRRSLKRARRGALIACFTDEITTSLTEIH
ncbi:hypothetical protein Tco_1355091 [Tanacetum coccineum]